MPIKEFFSLVRPRTLTAAFSPVFLGVTFAAYHWSPYTDISTILINIFLFLCVVILAQGTANIWNEYFDFKSGLDFTQAIGNSGSIVRNNVSPHTIKRLSMYVIGLALVLGFILSARVSLWLIPIGLACIATAYCYSGGPYPISRTPFGELSSGLAMGFVIVLVSAYLWTDTFYFTMLIPAIPSMVLIGLILQTNSTRDLENDRAHGRKTLSILVGREHAIKMMACGYIFVLLWLLVWTALGFFPLTALIALFAFIPAAKAIHIFKTYSDVHTVDKAMKFSAMTNTLYHILIGIALLYSR